MSVETLLEVMVWFTFFIQLECSKRFWLQVSLTQSRTHSALLSAPKHTLTVWWMNRGQLWCRYFAQEYFDMWTGGVGDGSTNFLIGRWPTPQVITASWGQGDTLMCHIIDMKWHIRASLNRIKVWHNTNIRTKNALSNWNLKGIFLTLGLIFLFPGAF